MRFPSMLTKYTSAPFIYSANFTFQLDFDYRLGAITVLRSDTQKPYFKIPIDLLNVIDNSQVALVFSRLRWERHSSERRLRIAT